MRSLKNLLLVLCVGVAPVLVHAETEGGCQILPFPSQALPYSCKMVSFNNWELSRKARLPSPAEFGGSAASASAAFPAPGPGAGACVSTALFTRDLGI